MQLLYPLMLLFAAGIIPIILLIHSLKPKPKPIVVTNLFLWQEVFKERSSNVRLKRLRKNLPLLLQILVVLLIVFALAQPVWFYFTHKHGKMILVIDTSASMQTKTADKKTRFDAAKERAIELIDQRDNTQPMLLIDAGSEPSLLSGFLSDSAKAKELVQKLQSSDAPGKLEQAVYLALSFIDPTQDDMIYLMSDGAGGNFEHILQMHPKIQPVLISGGARNIGITRFEFRQEPNGQDAYQIMLEVENFTSETVDCPLRLLIDRIFIFDKSVTLAPSEKKMLIFPYSGIISGIAKAELDINDDFPIDNSAALALNTTEDVWVLLASKGNYFVEKLLESYPNLLVNKVTEIAPSSWQEQITRNDIVIVDRMDVPPADTGNFLLIDAYSPSVPIVKTGETSFPALLDWDAAHPLLKDVNARDVVIERADVVQADSALRPVLESAQTGLMYAYQKDTLRAVFLGFDVMKSDLPFKVAFPVMMSNVINWLNPNKLSFSTLHTKAGEPFSIYLRPQTQEFTVRAPGQKWEKYQVASNPFNYTDTRRVGVYSISENEKRRYFTVNLLDETESNIATPNLDLLTATRPETSEAERISTQQPLWTLLLLLGMIAVMAEWYAWLKIG